MTSKRSTSACRLASLSRGSHSRAAASGRFLPVATVSNWPVAAHQEWLSSIQFGQALNLFYPLAESDVAVSSDAVNNLAHAPITPKLPTADTKLGAGVAQLTGTAKAQMLGISTST